jgi:hypothetical protein
MRQVRAIFGTPEGRRSAPEYQQSLSMILRILTKTCHQQLLRGTSLTSRVREKGELAVVAPRGHPPSAVVVGRQGLEVSPVEDLIFEVVGNVSLRDSPLGS